MPSVDDNVLVLRGFVLDRVADASENLCRENKKRSIIRHFLNYGDAQSGGRTRIGMVTVASLSGALVYSEPEQQLMETWGVDLTQGFLDLLDSWIDASALADSKFRYISRCNG